MEEEIRELIREYTRYLNSSHKPYSGTTEQAMWEFQGEFRAYSRVMSDLRELLSNEDRCGV